MDHDPLRAAAETALLAPSIFNTQPWRWVIRSGRLELWADRTRQLDAVDPGGRLLTISCGVALHHADIALGGAVVNRLPEPDQMAALSPPSGAVPDPKLLAAIRNRRTDRRAFTRQPVSPGGFGRDNRCLRTQGRALLRRALGPGFGDGAGRRASRGVAAFRLRLPGGTDGLDSPSWMERRWGTH